MEKHCSKCDILKPLSAFSKQVGGKHGVEAACKVCRSRSPNPVQLSAVKTCSKCAQVKTVHEFYANKRAPDGRQLACKACSLEWMQMYRAEHGAYVPSEAGKAKAKAYRRTPAARAARAACEHALRVARGYVPPTADEVQAKAKAREDEEAAAVVARAERAKAAAVRAAAPKRNPAREGAESSDWEGKARDASPARRAAHTERQRRSDARYPEKAAARRAVANALRSGAMQYQPCERCGAALAHAHHPDYSKPLLVQWLCPEHHRDEHERMAASAHWERREKV